MGKMFAQIIFLIANMQYVIVRLRVERRTLKPALLKLSFKILLISGSMRYISSPS